MRPRKRTPSGILRLESCPCGRTSSSSRRSGAESAASSPCAPHRPRVARVGVLRLRFDHRDRSELPKLDPQRQLDHQVNGYIYDRQARPRLFARVEARTLVKYDDVSDPMRHAIVAIEDRRFWEHDGVDLRGILRARRRHPAAEVVEGGSTITQQFVKNALDRDQKTIARKVREAAFAWQLERSKDGPRRILQEYLNTIYFGNGAYGIQQAARTYFQHGEGPHDRRAALLAGIPADPNRYDPVTNPKAALARRATVLNAMLEEGKITLAQLREAAATPLPDADDVQLGGIEGPAQHFVNYVKQLIDEYGSAGVFGGGLRVRTTIDLELQRKARDAISKWLTQPDGPSAALVAIDPATAPSARWSAATTTARASSTSPSRASASPARPSSRSCSRPRCGRASRPRPTSRRSLSRSTSATGTGWSATTRLLPRLDRPRDRDGRVGQRRLRTADPARRLEERRRDGARPGHPEQARRLLRDRPRRRGRQPARARAGVRHARLRRPPGRRGDVRQQAARDRAGDGARRPEALQQGRASRRSSRTRPGS